MIPTARRWRPLKRPQVLTRPCELGEQSLEVHTFLSVFLRPLVDLSMQRGVKLP